MKDARILLSLRMWVMAWFVLALGVAVAAPVVQPRTMEIVCAGSGAAKILLHTNAGTLELGTHGTECPLCLFSAAPPPPASALNGLFAPLAHASTLHFSSPVVVASAVSPPARGPPFP